MTEINEEFKETRNLRESKKRRKAEEKRKTLREWQEEINKARRRHKKITICCYMQYINVDSSCLWASDFSSTGNVTETRYLGSVCKNTLIHKIMKF
jgi:hypothetical protein